jgi:membrane peptidoglycan carboxypeptidase
MDAAARVYFGISARQVNVWQAAMLAGLPRAPSRINPRVNPEAAAARAREVLNAMAETGALPAEQARGSTELVSTVPGTTPRPAGRSSPRIGPGPRAGPRASPPQARADRRPVGPIAASPRAAGAVSLDVGTRQPGRCGY